MDEVSLTIILATVAIYRLKSLSFVTFSRHLLEINGHRHESYNLRDFNADKRKKSERQLRRKRGNFISNIVKELYSRITECSVRVMNEISSFSTNSLKASPSQTSKQRRNLILGLKIL